MSAFSRLATVNVPTGARESIEVAVTSIDEFLAGGAHPVPDVVKIDVEGAELEVIEGMRDDARGAPPGAALRGPRLNAEYVELMEQPRRTRPSTSTPTCPVEQGGRNAHTLARPRSAMAA